jgi:hypothetical protein
MLYKFKFILNSNFSFNNMRLFLRLIEYKKQALI